MLPERASEAYIEALDKITAIADIDRAWSRFTVDDILWEHIDKVLQVQPERRAAAIRSQGKEIVRRFSEALSPWMVDLLVYGMDSSCAGLKFGRLAFISDELNMRDEYRSVLGEPPGQQADVCAIGDSCD